MDAKGLLDRRADSWPVQYWRGLESMQFLDRAMAIAAQAFVALLPVILLVSAAFSGGNGSAIADELVRRFDLSGGAVAAVRALFEVPAGVPREVNWLGVVVVLISGVSLSRRLARMYETAWGLRPLGPKVLWRSFVWLVVIAIYLVVMSSLRSYLREHVGWWVPLILVAISAGAFLLWWWSQHFFLGGRIRWRMLVPGAVANTVCALGMVLYGEIFMPRVLASQSEQFGPIGVSFALFSYLLATALTIVASAVFGALWAERHGYRPPAADVSSEPANE